MNPRDQDRLWKGIFEDDADRVRRESLERGLREIRRRRQNRAIVTSAAGCLALTLLILAARHRPRASAAPPEATPQRAPNPQHTPNATTVRILSDRQLFALFPGRPAALIGPPGSQQLIFLDR
jgi:hypothetical protein